MHRRSRLLLAASISVLVLLGGAQSANAWSHCSNYSNTQYVNGVGFRARSCLDYVALAAPPYTYTYTFGGDSYAVGTTVPQIYLFHMYLYDSAGGTILSDVRRTNLWVPPSYYYGAFALYEAAPWNKMTSRIFVEVAINGSFDPSGWVYAPLSPAAFS